MEPPPPSLGRPLHGRLEMVRAPAEDFADHHLDAYDGEPVFFPGEEFDEHEDEQGPLESFSLCVIYNPRRNVLEESVNFRIEADAVIAGSYLIVDYLGSGVFSRAVQCVELATGRMVCIKIIRNNKDFFDQSLGEIKLLRRLNAADPTDQHHVLRMYDYFYHKEHLFIVCELLRDNLYELYKYIAVLPAAREPTHPPLSREQFHAGCELLAVRSWWLRAPCHEAVREQPASGRLPTPGFRGPRVSSHAAGAARMLHSRVMAPYRWHRTK